jgi:uncharacterized protein (TIGR03000 family)
MYSMVLMAALTAGNATPYCHGCCGCWGGGWGGCYGCWGGCYGGCWGGCYGGCYGCFGGCMGCYGGYGYGGGGYGGAMTYPGTIYGGGAGGVMPGAAAPGVTAPSGEALPYPPEGKSKSGKEETRLSNKAKLVVELPPNSKLFIDDKPMKNVSGVRTFNTPDLEPGQAYYYMVRVETERDGKPVSETRRVIVRAGQIARADFKDIESEAVRTARAK